MSGSLSASKRNAFAVVSALILSLAIESQATAAPAWTVPTAVTASPATVYGMATGGPSTLVIVYSKSTASSCAAAQTLGRPGQRRNACGTPAPAAVAGYGSDVDVAWVDGSKLVYMRSTDGGASFGSAQVLANTTTLPPADPHIARGPDGIVTVLWESSNVRARSAETVACHFAAQGRSCPVTRQPAIAVGEGVIYVAHHNQSKLFVERSFDQGATWSAPNRLASNMAVDGYGLESMSLIASGQSA